MTELFLHDQKGDAVDCRYSIQTEAGGILFLFNEFGITAREVFETFKAGRAAYEWQDISTAPLNRPIMIWCVGSKYDNAGVKIGQMKHIGGTKPVPVISSTIYSTFPEAYTHWRALPAPPAALIADERTK
jgi:hypothetical protein